MNGLTFVHPAWFWALLLLPLLVGLRFWAHLRTARRLPGLVSPRLSHRLINGASHARRWTVFLLQWLALAGLITALARPQFGFEETEAEIDARNLLIAIDTSRSMLADDLPPNRLSRAKLAAKDIILSLPEDRIGLIAFAGKPFLQAPFTVDHEAVLESVDQLDTEIIPRGGTNLSAAVDLALETIEEAKIGKSAMILFSDGEALEGLAEVAKVRDRAKNLGLSLIAVGVGTTGGSIIPELDENGNPIPGVFVKDEQGQVVRTRLDPAALQELARGSGGYIQLGGGAPLAAVVDQIRKQLTTSREESETNRIPIERFMWPLGAAVVLMILSHLVPLLWLKPLPSRRLVPAGVRATLLIFLVPASLHAKDPLAGGQEAFEQKDYESALSAYEGSLGEKWSTRALNRLQLGIGAAAYRMNNYERAAEAYSSVAAAGTPEQRGQALYNLGNTLFRRGELALKPQVTDQTNPAPMQATNPASGAIEDWETAIEHYEASLALNPDNPKAAHNLEHVKKRLQDLKQQEQEKQDQENQEQKDQEKQDEKDQQEKQDQQKQDQNQNQQDPQNQDSEGQQDPNQQEQEQDQPQDPNEPKPDSQSGEDQQDPQSGNEPKQQPDPPQPQPGDMPPQPEEPKDGELEADPNQNQPQPANPTPAGNPADMQANPLTGYSPSEARQLLDSLADETEVRPLIQAPRGETFKNW